MAVSDLVRQGHEVIFRPEGQGGSYIRNLATGATRSMVARNGVYEMTFKLESYSAARKPPARDSPY